MPELVASAVDRKTCWRVSDRGVRKRKSRRERAWNWLEGDRPDQTRPSVACMRCLRYVDAVESFHSTLIKVPIYSSGTKQRASHSQSSLGVVGLSSSIFATASRAYWTGAVRTYGRYQVNDH